MLFDLFDDFFGGMEKDLHLFYSTPSAQYKDELCPVCQTRLSEVAKTGKAGCSECYTVFRPQLEYMLGRIHANTQHTGKVSESAGARLKLQKEIETLKSALQAAVEGQNFEQAAVLRDKIKALEAKEAE